MGIMDELIVNSLRRRYVAYYGEEPAQLGAVVCLETALGIVIPRDMKAISKFYSGGILGGISHYSFESSSRETNAIICKTLSFRLAISLPHRFIVLAEPAESSIVLDVKSGTVTWCDNFDVSRLGSSEMLGKPDTWPSYAAFFEYLLNMEDEERGEQG